MTDRIKIGLRIPVEDRVLRHPRIIIPRARRADDGAVKQPVIDGFGVARANGPEREPEEREREREDKRKATKHEKIAATTGLGMRP